MKLGLKHLIFCHSSAPIGTLAPGDRVDYELTGLRTDVSKHGDVYKRMLGALRDIAMDVCIASCTKKTGLSNSYAVNPDHTATEKEQHKFEKDNIISHVGDYSLLLLYALYPSVLTSLDAEALISKLC